MARIKMRVTAFIYEFEENNIYTENDAFDAVDYDTLGSLALDNATIVEAESEYDIEEIDEDENEIA